jgi:Leucine-rich repeat (LRR) protein
VFLIKNMVHLCAHENQLTKLQKEIENLINLKGFCINSIQIAKLPKEIINLTNLENFFLFDNPNLILSLDQKEWMNSLKENGCNVIMDNDLMRKGLI